MISISASGLSLIYYNSLDLRAYAFITASKLGLNLSKELSSYVFFSRLNFWSAAFFFFIGDSISSFLSVDLNAWIPTGRGLLLFYFSPAFDDEST